MLVFGVTPVKAAPVDHDALDAGRSATSLMLSLFEQHAQVIEQQMPGRIARRYLRSGGAPKL